MYRRFNTKELNQLKERILQGDTMAMNTLIENNIDLMWKMVMKYYGQRDEDVFGECVIPVMKAIDSWATGRYNGRSKLTSYIAHAIRFRVGKIRRGKASVKLEWIEADAPVWTTPRTELCRKEDMAVLIKVLGQLSDKERLMIKRRIWLGWWFSHIAEVNNTKRSTEAMRWYSLMKKARRLYLEAC